MDHRIDSGMNHSTQKSMLDRLLELRRSIAAALIVSPKDPVGHWLEWITLTALFLLGLFLWGDALSWGNVPWDQADWFDVSGPRLFYLQETFQAGQLPLHVSSSTGLMHATDRFLAVPDVIVSPQIILLRWISPGAFVLGQTLMLYSLGYWGLLRLKRHWRLSIVAFTPLFLIFNFNGHLVTHMAVGHIVWWAHLLLSWFVLWVVRLLEKGGGWRWAANISILLTIIFLQGGYHLFVWCWIFLAGLLIFNWRLRKPLLLALGASILLNFGRILPGALVAKAMNIGFLSGFTTVNELLDGLISLRGPARALDTVTPLNPLVASWEFDHYIGWAGVALLFLGGWFWLRSREEWKKPFAGLWAACGAMAVLSVGRIYRVVFTLHIPLLTGERVTSRFLLLPLLFVTALAAFAIQRALNRSKSCAYPVLIGSSGILLLINDLLQHRELWKLEQLEQLFPHQTFALLHPANHPDPAYMTALLGGLCVSLIALVVILIKARRSVD